MGTNISYSGPKVTRYLFVDAGCLRALETEIAKRYLKQDESLAVNWDALKGAHHKVFYYDAVPARDHNEPDTKWNERINSRMTELREIRRNHGYHVPLGDLRGKPVRQKKVDVMIAVDMLMHTFRGNMDECSPFGWRHRLSATD